MKNKIEITEIQRFCMHDGEGIRTTVFFKGCPLRCKWCHNPETIFKQTPLMFNEKKCVLCGACSRVCENGVHFVGDNHSIAREKCISCMKCVSVCPTSALEIPTKTVNASDIIKEVLKDKAFYAESGGLTVSGGEPTLQFEGLVELLSLAKAEGINTCVETCGAFNSSRASELCKYTDSFLFDIKDTDGERLKKNTGADLSLVLNNLIEIDKHNIPTVIRAVMIPEINMNREHYLRLAEKYKSLNNIKYIELLPYHPYGISKAKRLGISQNEYTVPTDEMLASAVNELKALGVRVKALGTVVS